MIFKTLLTTLMLALLASPALAANRGYRQQGIGSTYGAGDGFHGRRTASGETFNQWRLTAASRGLRFGTRVKVTNTRTHKSVIVTINDRGPFVRGRIIDISTAAAKAIGMDGIAPVLVEVL